MLRAKYIFAYEAKHLEGMINEFFEENKISAYTYVDIKPLGKNALVIIYRENLESVNKPYGNKN
jgi:hypothetical protein